MAAEGEEEEEDDDVAKLYPAFAWTRNTGVLVGGVLAEEEEEGEEESEEEGNEETPTRN